MADYRCSATYAANQEIHAEALLNVYGECGWGGGGAMGELGDQCKVVFAEYYWNQLGNRVREGKEGSNPPATHFALVT
jgi:hypothetical protein